VNPDDPSEHRCVCCGRPADLLAYEPDGWLCRPCSDELGRVARNYFSRMIRREPGGTGMTVQSSAAGVLPRFAPRAS
jgi:hypothetical protein